MASTAAVTEWDAQGNPITSSGSGLTPTEWDAQGTPIASVQQPQQLDLSNSINPATGQGYGLYKMTDSKGNVVEVPYNKVQQAASGGFKWADDNTRQQFSRDQAADTSRSGGTSYLSNSGMTPEQSDARARRIEDNMSAPMQAVAGVAKGAATLAKPIAEPVFAGLHAAGVAPDWDLDTEAHGKIQTAAKAGTIGAAVVPAAIAAPGATIVGTAGGMTGDMIGKVVGPHLGLNDKQTAILSDLLSLAGGVGGGIAGEGVASADSAAAAAAPRPPFTVKNPQKFVQDMQELGAVSPTEIKADALAAKSGINPGQASVDPEFASEQTHAMLHQSLLDVADQVAKDAGVDYAGWDANRPQTMEAPRDIFGTVSRNILDKAQADFKALDEASGGQWQRFDKAIKNVQDKMDEVAGIDDDEYGRLENRLGELKDARTQMVERMTKAANGGEHPSSGPGQQHIMDLVDQYLGPESYEYDGPTPYEYDGPTPQEYDGPTPNSIDGIGNGKLANHPGSGPGIQQIIAKVDNAIGTKSTLIDPVIADRATAMYRQGMALRDLNDAVRSSVERTAIGNGRVLSRVNPEKFGYKLAKLNDIPEDGGLSRLEQAVGKDRAAQTVSDNNHAIDQLAKAKLTDFSATGQKALSQIIDDNSASDPGFLNKKRITTDWNGVMKDFNALTPAQKYAKFGNEFNQVARFVRDRAWSQRARQVVGYVAKRAAIPGAIGGGYEAVKHALE